MLNVVMNEYAQSVRKKTMHNKLKESPEVAHTNT